MMIKTVILKMNIVSRVFLISLMLSTILGCRQQHEEEQIESPEAYETTIPEWTKDKNLYEVNIRQYTPEGTFEAFEKEIPRLKNMGVDILWLMPIHEIGAVNRKGSLGSYYSIKDFKSVNHHFGTKEDFSRLVKTIHDHGMFVLMDWVANHTAWDHEWTQTHPEFYSRNDEGNFMPPAGTDWDDVIDLNFDNIEVHEAMADAMLYWVREFDVDGYRLDAPELVPLEFWKRTRRQLDEIKPVFLLAEGSDPRLHEAFDMTYSAEMFHTMAAVAQGLIGASSLDSMISSEAKVFPQEAYRMRFLTTHDGNTWTGTLDSLLGPAHGALAVFTYTAPGMPLIYSGQESNIRQRLAFFDKDTIQWEDYGNEAFYRSLNNLKRNNEALWNGKFGGEYRKLDVSNSPEVFCFKRTTDSNTVITVLNLSDKKVHYNFIDIMEDTSRYFEDDKVNFETGSAVALEPWGYQVFVK